ncbi:MAG: SDR family NAD(P)-dependent oxidoreductase [Gammaproteobacteria bacterium]|nr:SDR family NAD(P)-dependent oxidoreductase [Gammaproteobacteria bacterium]
MKPQSILITGCSSGIGAAVAHGLQQRGYRVFASARKAVDVERLQQQGFTAVQLDLADTTSITNALATVLEATGGTLDALFNNGAYGQPGAVEDLPTDILRQQFDSNFFGTHELTRQVLSVMRRQGDGRIIFNSSLLGFVALPFRGAYNASKFALEGLVDTLRLELKLSHSPIKVVLIQPGPIISRFRANAYAAFQANIDVANSPYAAIYGRVAGRLQQESSTAPFTLPPEAVLTKVITALETPRPCARYGVTQPTLIFAIARRLLPSRWLDALLLAVAQRENR